jgi:hypothetical protein
VLIGVGAGLVAAGLGTAIVAPIVGIRRGTDPDHIFGIAILGCSTLGAGVGLWTYGATYGKRTGQARFTLLPQLAPDRVGLTVTSRF